jgi:hypothetical protein
VSTQRRRARIWAWFLHNGAAMRRTALVGAIIASLASFSARTKAECAHVSRVETAIGSFGIVLDAHEVAVLERTVALREIALGEGTYRVTLLFEDEVRTLEGPCDEVISALAVVVLARLRRPETPERIIGAADQPARPAIVGRARALGDPSAPTAREPNDALRWGASAHVELGWGAADYVVWWTELGLALRYDVLRFELGGRAMLPHRRELGMYEATVEIASAGAVVRVCVDPIRELGACVGAEASAVFGQGSGLSRDRGDVAPLWAFHAAVTTGVSFGAPSIAEVRVGLGAWLPIDPPPVYVNGLGEIYRVGASAQLFVEGAGWFG